jgi:hypothetical protein
LIAAPGAFKIVLQLGSSTARQRYSSAAWRQLAGNKKPGAWPGGLDAAGFIGLIDRQLKGQLKGRKLLRS